jgi:hypothetical protein
MAPGRHFNVAAGKVSGLACTFAQPVPLLESLFIVEVQGQSPSDLVY